MAQHQADYMTAEERELAQQHSGGQVPNAQLEQAREQRTKQDYVVKPEASELH